jgi:crotonobetainyl-CoA:carnitine CoA-transferase CaiB-like acyl-CoA transferase
MTVRTHWREDAASDDVGIGPGLEGGFARDFATADGQRVIVAALTKQQFADLARTTRLASTFAFLERVLSADFSACADLHAHRGAIAALLAPWFSRRTVADLAAAFAGTSVPWGAGTTSPAGPVRGPDDPKRRDANVRFLFGHGYPLPDTR